MISNNPMYFYSSWGGKVSIVISQDKDKDHALTKVQHKAIKGMLVVMREQLDEIIKKVESDKVISLMDIQQNVFSLAKKCYKLSNILARCWKIYGR